MKRVWRLSISMWVLLFTAGEKGATVPVTALVEGGCAMVQAALAHPAGQYVVSQVVGGVISEIVQTCAPELVFADVVEALPAVYFALLDHDLWSGAYCLNPSMHSCTIPPAVSISGYEAIAQCITHLTSSKHLERGSERWIGSFFPPKPEFPGHYLGLDAKYSFSHNQQHPISQHEYYTAVSSFVIEKGKFALEHPQNHQAWREWIHALIRFSYDPRIGAHQWYLFNRYVEPLLSHVCDAQGNLLAGENLICCGALLWSVYLIATLEGASSATDIARYIKQYSDMFEDGIILLTCDGSSGTVSLHNAEADLFNHMPVREWVPADEEYCHRAGSWKASGDSKKYRVKESPGYKVYESLASVEFMDNWLEVIEYAQADGGYYFPLILEAAQRRIAELTPEKFPSWEIFVNQRSLEEILRTDAQNFEINIRMVRATKELVEAYKDVSCRIYHTGNLRQGYSSMRGYFFATPAEEHLAAALIDYQLQCLAAYEKSDRKRFIASNGSLNGMFYTFFERCAIPFIADEEAYFTALRAVYRTLVSPSINVERAELLTKSLAGWFKRHAHEEIPDIGLAYFVEAYPRLLHISSPLIYFPGGELSGTVIQGDVTELQEELWPLWWAEMNERTIAYTLGGLGVATQQRTRERKKTTRLLFPSKVYCSPSIPDIMQPESFKELATLFEGSPFNVLTDLKRPSLDPLCHYLCIEHEYKGGVWKDKIIRLAQLVQSVAHTLFNATLPDTFVLNAGWTASELLQECSLDEVVQYAADVVYRWVLIKNGAVSVEDVTQVFYNPLNGQDREAVLTMCYGDGTGYIPPSAPQEPVLPPDHWPVHDTPVTYGNDGRSYHRSTPEAVRPFCPTESAYKELQMVFEKRIAENEGAFTLMPPGFSKPERVVFPLSHIFSPEIDYVGCCTADRSVQMTGWHHDYNLMIERSGWGNITVKAPILGIRSPHNYYRIEWWDCWFDQGDNKPRAKKSDMFPYGAQRINIMQKAGDILCRPDKVGSKGAFFAWHEGFEHKIAVHQAPNAVWHVKTFYPMNVVPS